MNDVLSVYALDIADADVAANLHAGAMSDPWDAAAWADFIADPLIVALGTGDPMGAGETPVGVILIRAVAGEAEILTIAVAKAARRHGLGARLLAGGLEAAASRGAKTAFLEVAVDNIAAISLYSAAGFIEIGRRHGYYRRPDGTVDALRMSAPVFAPVSTSGPRHGSN